MLIFDHREAGNMRIEIHTRARRRNGAGSGIGILAAVLAAAVLAAGCAKAPRTYRVGILVGADSMSAIADAFKSSMAGLGYVEGKNVSYDIQRSNAAPAEEKRISEEFVAEGLDLVFAFPGQPANAVKAAAKGSKIPVVFANAVIDGIGLVDSVRNPGDGITGVRVPSPDLTLKSFEALLDIKPDSKRIMTIYDPNYPTNPFILEALRSMAASSGVTLVETPVPDARGTAKALKGLEGPNAPGMDALLLLPDSITRSQEAAVAILAFADRHGVPVVGGPVTMLRSGTLLTATANQGEQGKLAASLADKIFKGVPPGSIPVATTRSHLFINYKRALELGLVVPEGLLKQASEILR
jgi:putative ABC transport system substrate-binding protein